MKTNYFINLLQSRGFDTKVKHAFPKGASGTRIWFLYFPNLQLF